jgi:hypothetical protein
MNAFSGMRLIAMANRCLVEPASRALDARIYCALLGLEDENGLSSPVYMLARARGMVLLPSYSVEGWIEAPRYTEDLASAKSLVPDCVSTISSDPRVVCATALTTIAVMGTPPTAFQSRLLFQSSRQ